MARKLKTYTTSAGFFDLAVAAPSMKAALEAWGARHNLFHQGFARETADPRIVAAAMARPGVVLRRAVGSNDAYSEHAELPRALPAGRTSRPPRPAKSKAKAKEPKVFNEAVDSKVAARASRDAALAFEREQNRQDSERRREEARLHKERQHRERAIAAAQEALEKATREHARRMAGIDKQRAALDRKAEAEQARWDDEKEELVTALSKARSVSYLRPVR